MASILAVGIATVDIIYELDQYPVEDSEVRALAHSVRRGGNATNTLVVLSQLGHRCDWAGTRADGQGDSIVMHDLQHFGVGVQHCQLERGAEVPTSCIIMNTTRGTRTIAHYRNLAEFNSRSFRAIPLQHYSWLHFEGRNIGECGEMMSHARKVAPGLSISLEAEKPRAGIEKLYPLADYIFFSSALPGAQSLAPREFLRRWHARLPGVVMTCSLGESGALAMDAHGCMHNSPSFRSGEIIDSVGAGDTLNAGFIDASLRGRPVAEALALACRLAGRKCARRGFDGLSDGMPAGSC